MINWQDYAPKTSFCTRESTEWSITYTFNSEDHEKPRVLLIGDSICNAYQSFVTKKLEGKVNVTFWASSKCVTHPDYFKELHMIASMLHYDVICFNNGLHSLSADRAEWEVSYRNAVHMIHDLNPEAVLYLTLSTPLTDAKLTAVSASLNTIVLKIAGETGYSVIDLFTPMDALDRAEYWRDCYHFHEPAVDMQAEIIKNQVLSSLKII